MVAAAAIDLGVEEDASGEITVSDLAMSDDDFINKPVQAAAPESSEDTTDTTEDDDQDQDEPDGDATQTEEEEEEDTQDPVETGEESELEEEEQAESESLEQAALDFEAEYKKILAPFQANGKAMQVDNVDDAIKLMQMGANYNKKMAAMKPGLKVLRMLEKAELLDEGKLNFLIDLNKRNPEAIKQLLKDGNIDPDALELDQDSEYKPSDNAVDDNEIELDAVIDDISHTTAYSRTIDIVGSLWDKESKQIVATQPQLLKVINAQVANGVYDLISTEVDRERMFGRLTDVSDIEAYRQIGDKMQSQGAFNHLAPKDPALVKATEAAPVTKPDATADALEAEKRRAKRKAAGPTKPAAQTRTEDFNPLAMSDEEFMKQHDPRLK
jgi:hypothetical protein